VANYDATGRVVSYTIVDKQSGQPLLIMEPAEYQAYRNAPLATRGQYLLAPQWSLDLGSAVVYAGLGDARRAQEHVGYVLASPEYWLTAGSTLLIGGSLTLAAGRGGMSGANAVANGGLRERVLGNLRESAVARDSSQIETFLAKSAQIESGYSADAWNATLLRQGDVVYALSPTKNPQFFTDLPTLQAVRFDMLSVSKALQIRAHPVYGYRPDVTGYRVTQDITVPGGTAVANPWYGPGGGTQFFIRDSEKYLEPISTINLRPR
jgi:hypothetical protein